MSLKQEFIIHPVGQGLFYSGKISWNSQVKFRMVFDCGSVTDGSGEEEVELYRDLDFTADKVLDLLVISHFDEDHICHLNLLLDGGIKVRKLVMPFLSFSERLFLVTRHIASNGGFDPTDEFFINFVIDPLATIGDNLDDGTEIILIESGPDEPLMDSKDVIEETESPEENNESRFSFDIITKKKEADNSLTLNSELNVFKVNDSEKGVVTSANGMRLMEFLFYRRHAGRNQEKFYEKVSELFYRKFSITSSEGDADHFGNVMRAIKKIGSASQIAPLFEEALSEPDFQRARGVALLNMNTTALSLLHKNLVGLFRYSGYSDEMINHDLYYFLNHHDSQITRIQKFRSLDSSRIETPMDFDLHRYFYSYHRTGRFVFPNVLLTSDSFLLRKKQVQEFINHYKNYWNDYWLFQIPHHGSKKNSNGILHSLIHPGACDFINYGTTNSYNHPSSAVIKSLMITGRAVRLVPVNEFSGMRFCLTLDNFR